MQQQRRDAEFGRGGGSQGQGRDGALPEGLRREKVQAELSRAVGKRFPSWHVAGASAIWGISLAQGNQGLASLQPSQSSRALTSAGLNSGDAGGLAEAEGPTADGVFFFARLAGEGGDGVEIGASGDGALAALA